MHYRSNVNHRRQLMRAAEAERPPRTTHVQKPAKPSLNETIQRLERGDIHARLRAGEIALEAAFAAPSVLETSVLFARAEQSFKACIENGRAVGYPLGEAARAMIHLAQMPNHGAMAATQKLPSLPVVERSYRKTVQVGNDLSQAFHIERKKGWDRRVSLLAGVLGETAVLLLGQRYAIKHIQDESWLPMLALYSEDHANKRSNASINKAWDVSVFTDLSEGPQTAYRVQVKTSETANGAIRQEDAEGITRLHLRPDLMLPQDRNFSVTTVIRECFKEMTYETPGMAYTLDQRSEQMLDIFDHA